MEAALDKMGVAVKCSTCEPYYHPGALMRACLSAMRTGILVILGEATYLGGYMHADDSYKDFDMTYDKWVKKLWNDLDDSCKVDDLDQATLEQIQSKIHCQQIFFGYDQFESIVRRLLLPNNERSLTHLVMKTAWEVKTLLLLKLTSK